VSEQQSGPVGNIRTAVSERRRSLHHSDCYPCKAPGAGLSSNNSIVPTQGSGQAKSQHCQRMTEVNIQRSSPIVLEYSGAIHEGQPS
jgi:hypothetical protein